MPSPGRARDQPGSHHRRRWWSAPPRQSGQSRRPCRCAASARTGVFWCHASPAATRLRRTASGRCCRPAGGRPRPPCAAGAAAPPASQPGGKGWCGLAPPEAARAGGATEPISPSVWRRARRNTARRVSAVKIASGEYQGCPPGVVRGAARQSSMAASENHTVRLPRWRRLASYSRQF